MWKNLSKLAFLNLNFPQGSGVNGIIRRSLRQPMQSFSLLVLLCFTAFLNFFFFRSIGSFGTQIFLVGFWIFIYVLSLVRNNNKHNVQLFTSTCLGLIVFTLLILTRSNPTIVSLLQLASAFLVIITLYSTISTHPHIIALMEVISIPLLTFRAYLQSVQQSLSGKKQESRLDTKTTMSSHLAQVSKFRPIIGGLLLSAPIAFVLLSLFANADPVFESFIKNIVGQNFLENMIWRAIFSIVCFGLGFPMLTMERNTPFNNPVNRLSKWNLVTEFSVVMSVVGCIIGLFLIIQWRYIFVPPVAGINLSQYGVQTYSEYVNRGFTELLTASLFIFSLIWTGLILMRNKTSQVVRVLKSLQLFVLGEFVILLFSVFRRIVLYQHYHGMSLIRYYGGCFLAFLFFLTITLFLRHLFKFRFVVLELLIVGVGLIGFSLFNAEKYIALYHPPTVNNRVDYVYLSRMSVDGFDGWQKSYAWTRDILEQQYPQNATISAESRRQVAYAGITLEQLLSRYNELIIQEGSRQQIKEYYQTVFVDILKQIDTSAIALDSIQTTILAHPEDEKLTKDFSNFRQDLNNSRAKVQGYLDALQKDEFSEHRALVSPNNFIEYNNHSGKIQFNSSNCSFWGMCYPGNYYGEGTPNTFYTLTSSDLQNKSQRTLLDNILSWNPTKQNALVRFQKEMPIQTLLDLQQKYFVLYRQISQQPDSEREYDADISLDTPFLTPLR